MRRKATANLTVTAASTTYKLGVFIAPCKCTVTKASINACPFPDYATSTWDVHKANIGVGDTALITQLSIDGSTTDTELEGVLSTTAGELDLIEGQLVYTTITLGASEAVAGEAIAVQVEYVPTER